MFGRIMSTFLCQELTHFFSMHPFSTPLKNQKTVRFSDVFRGKRNGALRNKWAHCVKSVSIRSFSGPYSSAFGLNTKNGEIRSRKGTEYRNIRMSFQRGIHVVCLSALCQELIPFWVE